MKKVVLFSPTGYVGHFIKERIGKEKNIKLYEMTRKDDLREYKEDYDIMVYSAAITSGRHESPDKYVEDNVVAAVSIINFCKEHHIERIIYLSSDEIYGELNTDIVTERAVMINPNLYAATKYLAEKIIIESKIPYYILRLPGVVGRIWGKNFIYNLMDKMRNNEPVSLYNMDKEFNNILDVDDLTRFILLLCNCEKKNDSEIFLLGNTEKIYLRELIFYIKELYQSTSQIDDLDGGQKRYFTLDVTKAVEYGYFSKKIKTIMDELYCIGG